MCLVLCNPQEITEIYNNHIKNDFPPAEVKPLSRILMLYEKNLYFVYALYEKDELLSYAFFSSAPGCEYVLLDYLAVVSGKRNMGIGAKMLDLLKTEVCKNFNGILLESENPDFAKDEEEKEIRVRRIAFYLRYGFEITKMHSCLFGVEYKILAYCRVSHSTLSLTQALSDLYKSLIAEKHMAENVSLRVDDSL
ncbi:MAG: GNAT family N-acetyltransferase [Clostridia bacterium]|nr:GNAT family N-acetyltransferase [Clostridia bacterium]